MIFDPFKPYVPSEFRIKYAVDGWEHAGAAHLRRQVFCEEQKIFAGDDRDDIDRIATALVAISYMGVAASEVVGTVRIHQAEPGVWWGSRLAVSSECRRIGALGTGLIRLAVSSAHARGCRRFLAHVQSQNGLLFQRLNWRIIEPVDLHGHAHFLMEADLDHYPPFVDVDTGFHAMARAA
jgi:putative N-acetyltransferase (TIGR04045 family)